MTTGIKLGHQWVQEFVHKATQPKYRNGRAVVTYLGRQTHYSHRCTNLPSDTSWKVLKVLCSGHEVQLLKKLILFSCFG